MVLDEIKQCGVVAVVRSKTQDEAREYVKACLAGGVKPIELTYSIPNVCELIREYRDNDDMILGVGSVLNAQMALDAIDAGARYVVSPGYSEDINKVCKEKNIPYLPGCMTISEIMMAREAGNKMIKLFPGDQFEPSFVKAVKAPIPDIEIMPTGGVSVDNIEEWFENGVACVGVGSSLIKGTPQDIENKAKEFTNKMTKIRSKMLN